MRCVHIHYYIEYQAIECFNDSTQYSTHTHTHTHTHKAGEFPFLSQSVTFLGVAMGSFNSPTACIMFYKYDCNFYFLHTLFINFAHKHCKFHTITQFIVQASKGKQFSITQSAPGHGNEMNDDSTGT